MKYKNFFSIILLVLIVDQVSKFFLRDYLSKNGNMILIRELFSLTLTKNTGAGFSILSGNNMLLIFLGVLIISVLLYLSFTSLKERYLALSLIVAGALSNLSDRIFFGGVTDFISVSIFPVFNLADVSITLGVLMLLIPFVKEELDSKKKKRK